LKKSKVFLEKQYDLVGEEYIKRQLKFYNDHEDVPRAFIRKFLLEFKDKIVLDAGCGFGKDILIYEKANAKEVFGIDSSKLMVSEAKKFVSHPERIFVKDIRNTEFPDKYFDIIVSRYALHYLTDIDAFYKEAFRILKDDGLLIVVTDHPLGSLLKQKKKIYGKREIVPTTMMIKTAKIYFPTHTFKDYFSETFFSLFRLEYFDEAFDNFHKIPGNSFKFPNFLGFKARKVLQ
jgi:ubiquinone/menaquinone biosynthesis C-methylase UbiE